MLLGLAQPSQQQSLSVSGVVVYTKVIEEYIYFGEQQIRIFFLEEPGRVPNVDY